MAQSRHGTERAPVLAKDLSTSYGGLKLDGAGQLHRQGGTGQVANCPPVWVRSLYCWQSKHIKGGKENHMLSPRRMWDREKYHTGCEIQKFRKMALLVSVKLEVATLRETQGATMQRNKTRCGHLSECDTSITSKWQKFPAEDAIVLNAIVFYKVLSIRLIIFILMCFSFLHCNIKSISFPFT